MKYKHLIPALALPFLIVACNKVETVSEKVGSGADKIAEGVKEVADATATGVKEATDEAKKAADEAAEKLKADAAAAARNAADAVKEDIKEAVKPPAPE